jgi:hypothetical protein
MPPSYPIEIEKQMQEMFGRLSEKDKRLHAGVEALKFQAKATFDFLRNVQGFNVNELEKGSQTKTTPTKI